MADLQIIIAGSTGMGKTTVAHLIRTALDKYDILGVVHDDVTTENPALQIKRLDALSKKNISIKIATVQTHRENSSDNYDVALDDALAKVKLAARTGKPIIVAIQECNCAHDRACKICYVEKMKRFENDNSQGIRRSAFLRCTCNGAGTCDLCIALKTIADQEIKCRCNSSSTCVYCVNRRNRQFDPLLGPIPCPDGKCHCSEKEVCELCLNATKKDYIKDPIIIDSEEDLLKHFGQPNSGLIRVPDENVDENERESCPDCETGKLYGAPGGGVKCNECAYWFCF